MTHVTTRKIRTLTGDDLGQVLAWRNHPDVRRVMYTQHEITISEHARWFERASLESGRQLLIYESEGRPLGFINLKISSGGLSDWGFYVSPKAPRGTGSAMGHTLLPYAFEQLGVHKICGKVLAFNERSIRFHLRLGFQREGVLREEHFDGQKYHDVMYFGLLVTDWQANRES